MNLRVLLLIANSSHIFYVCILLFRHYTKHEIKSEAAEQHVCLSRGGRGLLFVFVFVFGGVVVSGVVGVLLSVVMGCCC